MHSVRLRRSLWIMRKRSQGRTEDAAEAAVEGVEAPMEEDTAELHDTMIVIEAIAEEVATTPETIVAMMIDADMSEADTRSTMRVFSSCCCVLHGAQCFAVCIFVVCVLLLRVDPAVAMSEYRHALCIPALSPCLLAPPSDLFLLCLVAFPLLKLRSSSRL